MINLDNKESLLPFPTSKIVLQSVENLDKQLHQSFTQSLKIKFPKKYKKAKNIVISGMGGSRFPGYIIRQLFKNKLTVPLILNNDYHLPSFVGKDTLVITSSYSGTTEEVINNFRESKKKKALITAITSGGKLENLVKTNKLPAYVFNPIYNPSNQPRIGFGYGVGGILGLLVNLGYIEIDEKKVLSAFEKTSSFIRGFSIEKKINENRAKGLALKIYNHYPFYIVSDFLIGVGNAFANQTNETAKLISDYRIIPELNHHLMEGLKFPKKIKDTLLFVFFSSLLYSPKIQKRFEITKEIVEKNQIKTLNYQLSGKSKLEQALEMMALGSFTTMYLSILYKQDASAVPYVTYFKKQLKSATLPSCLKNK